MDRLDGMLVFVTVADLGGFAPAARRLRRSASAVTRQVASLEEHLGTRLLQRTTRAVALTDAGTRFLARARRILAEVAEAEGAAQAERSVPSGRLVVSAPVVFGRMHVAPLLCGYLQKYRDVTGELTLTDRRVSLVDEGVDVAVRIGALDDSSLIARAVGATRRVAVASPAYLARKKKLRAPEDLAHHDTILCTALTPSPEWTFVREGAPVRVSIRPRRVTNSVDAALTFATLGSGVALCLAYQVADAVRADTLRVVLDAFEPEALPIHAVYPTSRLLSARVRAFVERITATCDWRFVTFGEHAA